jgi:hypothetical protein
MKMNVYAGLAVIAVALVLTGCMTRHAPAATRSGGVPPPAARVKATRALTAEEARIVEIARQAVASNDTWVDRAEFELPQRQPEGGWSVMVWRLPATPGGFRVVMLDEKGKVTAYHRGH